MIPYDDFGGRGPVLHFSHPNAYPPRCFHRFLALLAAQFHVIAARHRPLWYLSPGAPAVPGPETFSDWSVIAGDLLAFLEQERLEGIVGVGHSLGAVATMKAALHEPRRFRALALIEPVFLPPAILDAARADPAATAGRELVTDTLRRRNCWDDRRAAFYRFREKRVFARFSDEALWDYVNEGLHEDPATGEIALSFPREWEAAFYAYPPLDVWAEVAELAALGIPTLAVRGGLSDTLFSEAWARWQTLQPAATFVELPDVGHMLTMEAPEAAGIVVRWLEGDREQVVGR
jgi:pimeloyl-ACP methyl ester carboxylesterase